MSPFCPGLTLEECPSQQASELRGQIERRISARQTNRQIDGWLVREYGESVLGRPSGSLAWTVPAGFAAAGFALVLFALTRPAGRGRPSGGPPPATGPDQPPAPTDEQAYRTRMLEDLSRFAKGTE